MTRRRIPRGQDNSGPTGPTMDPVVAIASLQEQKERGLAISSNPHPDAEARQGWYNTTRAILSAAFGPDSPNISAVMHAGPGGRMWPFGTPGAVIEAANMRNLKAAAMMLDSCMEQLRLLGPTLPVIRTGLNPQPEPGTSVFIVHGTDDGKKEAVARFLTTLGLDPIILHEQPNQGRTLIEKFEAHADVSFAVVILTGDDKGGPIECEVMQPRGRQNVVFELGYFVGQLSRKQVCTLYEEGVEIPSDFSGIVYIPLDAAGAWRTLLARELKAAGFQIDMNRAV